ncbi:MAG TPA: GNAT family protein [Deinococcales bacterium]|nr:GNAT family protein [Deinococcales bacterium]
MSEPVYAVQSDKVGLGVPREEGLADITRWFQNLEMTAYLGSIGRAYTATNERAWLDRVLAGPEGEAHFFIYARPEGRLVGTCGLFAFTPSGTATLGICIGDPEAWGRGYGSEAVRLLVQYGMYFRNLHAVNLRVLGFNRRAVRAYEKAGFRVAGRLRGAILMGHERFDEIWMDITRDEVDLSPMRAMIGQLEER